MTAAAMIRTYINSALLTLTLLAICVSCDARINRKWRPSEHRTTLPDFRYNSARVDGITRLFNDSLIVISNGHYWMLDKGELPRARNVKGSISELYSGFKNIDAIWTDPYNDVGQQVYLVSNSPSQGLRVVCQEFAEPFTNDSSFCHLPVDASWRNALKDIQADKPIDAVTWRNRTKDKDGGFWVFFQGSKMITIDPYEMRSRFTYDIKKWMNISKTITAAMYNYKRNRYEIFFDDDHDQYRTWTVNVSFMNSLPMSWDRAFLHGTLSPPMKINRHFFGFPEREVRNWSQPFLDKISSVEEIVDNRLDSDDRSNRLRGSNIGNIATENTPSDVLYIEPKEQNGARNGKLQIEHQLNLSQGSTNSIEHDDSDQISYQKQLMQFEIGQVLDFAPDAAINGQGFITLCWSCLVTVLCSTKLIQLIYNF